MRFPRFLSFLSFVFLLPGAAFATMFGSVQGLVHDPQHRPMQGVQVKIQSTSSDWSQTQTSNSDGELQFSAVPLGTYTLFIDTPGFAPVQQKIVVSSGSALGVHYQLALAQVRQNVEVAETGELVTPESAASKTMIAGQEIAATPGAQNTNSMAMITDFVPSAVMVHDQLHIRGGHQVSWLLDGVPVPNTNIASNVGPQFDPKDIASIEVQRGGFSAEYGDRTYGVFNVITRSGFERNNQAELVTSYGSFNQTNDQFSIGSHTDRFAYYASVNGYRTDLGLETPTPDVLHDQAAGVGGYLSLIFNRTPADQFRLALSSRADHYQVPNSADDQSAGVRDVDDETDRFANLSWTHTASNGVVFTVAPFYHFNRARYIGGPLDEISPNDDRGSTYAGGVATVSIVHGKHNASAGLQGFGERDSRLLVLLSPTAATQEQDQVTGSVQALFFEEQYKATSWLTLNGGLRFTHFSGAFAENATNPRVGAAIRIPRLNWVLRSFYGRYYQAPPLLTVGGPVLALAADQGFGFLPLRGERDEQHEVGLTIPIPGWTLDITNFRTSANNYFDHDALGSSNIFFPLTLARARIYGWETTVRSHKLFGVAQFHLAYSHQHAEAAGAVTGGLTDFTAPDAGFFFLDHDQRDTLSTGVQLDLPYRTWASTNINYGSGFLNGDGPAHLPSHTTLDLALGKSFGEAWSVGFTALNLTNQRYMLDSSNTFGGSHFVNPRELAVQVKFRFHY
jgi:outer membrane receptor protein involved in Fe transport